jgi:hypothetical protein
MSISEGPKSISGPSRGGELGTVDCRNLAKVGIVV